MEFFSIFDSFDFSVFSWIQENIWCGFLDKLMPIITVLGEGGWFWIVLAVVLLISKKYRKAGVSMAFALITMLILNDLILKNLFARPRPFNYEPFAALYENFTLLVSKPSSFSFPSGHTSSSFAAAAAVLFNKKYKLGIPALILAVLIGFSRNYLMVHYPTDVLFGALMGIVYAAIGTFLFAKFIYPLFEKYCGKYIDRLKSKITKKEIAE